MTGALSLLIATLVTSQPAVTVTDARGRVLSSTETINHTPSTTHFRYDAEGHALEVKYEDGKFITQTYDAAGRLRTRTDETGATTTSWTYEADGLVKSVLTKGPSTEPQAFEDSEYDALGRVKTQRTQLADGGLATTRFAYPGNGVIEVTDAESQKHTKRLSATGEVVEETHLDGGYVVTRSFNGHRLAKEEIREGAWHAQQQLTWYDSGRLQSSIESFSTTKPDSVSWTYSTTHNWRGNTETLTHLWTGDFLGGLEESTTVDAQGLPLVHARGTLRDEWLHDAAGRVVRQAASDTPATTFAYGEDGRLAKSDFVGETTESTYDNRGRLFTLKTPDGRVRTRTYEARGLLEKETYGTPADAGTTFFEYDGLGHLKGRTEGYETPDAVRTGFAYGPRGELLQVTQQTDVGKQSVWSYDYDGLNRLVEMTPPGGSLQSQHWTYDGLNRTTLHLDGAKQWLTAWDEGVATTTAPGTTFDGGVASGSVTARVLDSRGRLLRETVVGLGDSVASVPFHRFAYDGLDALRVMEEGTQSQSVYDYDGPTHLLKTVRRGTDVIGYDYEGASARIAHINKQLLSGGSLSVPVQYDYVFRGDLVEGLSARNAHA